MRRLTPLTTTHCCDGCLDTGYLGASSPRRTCVVRVKSGVSEVDTMTIGVPQGTVIGRHFYIHHHLYADDTQLYINSTALTRKETCVQDAKAWLSDNGSVMNDNKSQDIVIRSSSLRTQTSTRINKVVARFYCIRRVHVRKNG